VTVYDTNGNADSNVNNVDTTPNTPNAWQTDGGTLVGTYAADGIVTIRYRLTAKSNASFELGKITFNYYSKF